MSMSLASHLLDSLSSPSSIDAQLVKDLERLLRVSDEKEIENTRPKLTTKSTSSKGKKKVQKITSLTYGDENLCSVEESERIAMLAVNTCISTLTNIWKSGWKFDQSPDHITAQVGHRKATTTSQFTKSNSSKSMGRSTAPPLQNGVPAKQATEITSQVIITTIDVAVVGIGRLVDFAKEKKNHQRLLEVEAVRGLIIQRIIALQASSLLKPLLSQSQSVVLTLYFHIPASPYKEEAKSLTPAYPLPHPVEIFFLDPSNVQILQTILLSLCHILLSLPSSELDLIRPDGLLPWLRHTFQSPEKLSIKEDWRAKLENLVRLVFSRTLKELRSGAWSCLQIRLAGLEAVLWTLEHDGGQGKVCSQFARLLSVYASDRDRRVETEWENVRFSADQILAVLKYKWGVDTDNRLVVPKDEREGWSKVVGVLLFLATEAQDIPYINWVASLSEKGRGKVEKEEEDMYSQFSRVTSNLALWHALLQNLAHGDNPTASLSSSTLSSTFTDLAKLRRFILSNGAKPEQIQQSIQRLYSEVGKVRALALAFSQKTNIGILWEGKGKEREKDVDAILLELVRWVEGFRQESFSDENILHLIIDAVETLIALSNKVFFVEHPSTWTKCLDLLQRAFHLLSVELSPDFQDVTISCPTLSKPIRVVATTLFNFGLRLYNSKHAEGSVRFLERSCLISNALLNVDDGLNEKELKILDELRPNVARRWDVFGLSLLDIREYDRACIAFVSSLKSFSSSFWINLVEQFHSCTLQDLIQQTPDLFKKMQRITKLYLNHTSPAPLRVSSLQVPRNIETVVDTILLEFQLSALDPLLISRDEARLFAIQIIEELLHIYNEKSYPIQRARILCRLIELKVGEEDAFDFLQMCSEEIVRLCTPTGSSTDNLHRLKHQYIGYSNLWLAILTQGQPDWEKIFEQNASAALQNFVVALWDVPDLSHLKAEMKSKSKKSKTTQIKKKGLGSKNDEMLRTPPLTCKIRGGEEKNRISGSRNFEDQGRLQYHLTTMAHLCAALSYPLLQLGFLRLLHAISPFEEDRNSKLDIWFVLAKEADQGHVNCSIQLARSCLAFGKRSKAMSIWESLDGTMEAETQVVDPSTRTLWLLGMAEYHVFCDNYQLAEEIYIKAWTTEVDSRENRPVKSDLLEKTDELERAAHASTICSKIHSAKGNLSKALATAMQSVRLWHRGLNGILRSSSYHNSTASQNIEVNPFSSEKGTSQKEMRPLRPQGSVLDEVAWRLFTGLVTALFEAIRRLLQRGSWRAVDSLLDQLLGLSQAASLPSLRGRALNLRAELRLLQGLNEDARADSDVAADLVNAQSVDSILNAVIRGKIRELSNPIEASELYTFACQECRALEVLFNAMVELVPSSNGKQNKKSLSVIDAIFPTLNAMLVHTKLSVTSESKEQKKLRNELSKFNVDLETKAEEQYVLSTLRFHSISCELHDEGSLWFLQEAVLSMPLLGECTMKQNIQRDTRKYLGMLSDVKDVLLHSIRISYTHGNVRHLRRLCSSVVTTSFWQSALSEEKPKDLTYQLGFLSDLGTNHTLERERIENYPDLVSMTSGLDDRQWDLFPPVANTKPTSLYRQKNPRPRRPLLKFDDAECEFLHSVKQLPKDCIVVSMQVSADKENLIMIRYNANRIPVSFQLPFDRFSKREGEVEVELTLSLAREELHTIITINNELSDAAPTIYTAEDKANWWEERKALDLRMYSLLQTIEKRWLGSFKCLFSGYEVDEESTRTFTSELESLLQATLLRAYTRKPSKNTKDFHLEQQIIECFVSCHEEYTDDELEDFLHFVMDSYQTSGLVVPSDEVDADQIGCEIRNKLEQMKIRNQKTKPPKHIFLILSKELQCFPWESLPILQDRSVSRVPSISFLQDRLNLTLPHSCELAVDGHNARYLLNPKGDLKHTQSIFQPWLQNMSDKGWSGIIGRAPMDLEVKQLFSGSLFLYFGHGGGEQFIKSTIVRNLSPCPVAMLWGCSSGLLKEMGEFDLSGTPHNYMLAGCPTLVANLWDVTDKDIDRLAHSVFTHMGLTGECPNSTPLNLTLALARARDATRLRYLTGAAAVCYGIPSRLVL